MALSCAKSCSAPVRIGLKARDEDEEVEGDRRHCRLNVRNGAGTIPWQWECSRSAGSDQRLCGRLLARSEVRCGCATWVEYKTANVDCEIDDARPSVRAAVPSRVASANEIILVHVVPTQEGVVCRVL